MIDSLGENMFQMRKRSVGVGISLKIGDIGATFSFGGNLRFCGFNLDGDGSRGGSEVAGPAGTAV